MAKSKMEAAVSMTSRLATIEAERRRELGAEYLGLLERANGESISDDELRHAADLAKMLGRDDLRADAAMIPKLAEAREAGAKVPEMQANYKKAAQARNQEITEAKKTIEDLRKRIELLEHQGMGDSHRIAEAQRSGRLAIDLDLELEQIHTGETPQEIRRRQSPPDPEAQSGFRSGAVTVAS
jgi:hypothetical protein